MRPDLSVLVCGIHTRYRTYTLAIQDQLWEQYARLRPADRDRVEIMVLTDNKSLSIGHKRNAMVHAATGQYVVFVDDDDRVSDNYLSTLLAATESDADVITFNSMVTINGGPAQICRFSREYGQDYNTEDEYLRIPNHLAAVKRVLARATGWGDIMYGEDRDYSTRLLPRLNSEHKIDQVLYYYDYDQNVSESRC